MKKNILGIMLVAVLVGALPVLAHEEDAPKPEKVLRGVEKAIERLEKIELPEIESVRENPQSLFIGPHGEVRVHSGEITALASTTMTVKVWSLSLSVDVSRTRYLPAGTSAASLKVGDKVNVKGTMTASGVVDASLVHQLSGRLRLIDELRQQIDRLIERLRELQRQAGLPQTATTTP